MPRVSSGYRQGYHQPPRDPLFWPIRGRYSAQPAADPMNAARLTVASFNALADARAQLDVAIAQAMVRVARVEGSERAAAEAHKLGMALAGAIEAVRAVGRCNPLDGPCNQTIHPARIGTASMPTNTRMAISTRSMSACRRSA